MSILAAYDKAYDIEEELHAKDLRIYIERLVNELPPRQKEVFYLSRHEQLSYKEIAERLDITPKTVERHINEALKYLKKEYLLPAIIPCSITGYFPIISFSCTGLSVVIKSTFFATNDSITAGSSTVHTLIVRPASLAS